MNNLIGGFLIGYGIADWLHRWALRRHHNQGWRWTQDTTALRAMESEK